MNRIRFAFSGPRMVAETAHRAVITTDTLRFISDLESHERAAMNSAILSSAAGGIEWPPSNSNNSTRCPWADRV